MSDELTLKAISAYNGNLHNGMTAALEAVVAMVLEEAAKVADELSDRWTKEWRAGLKADSRLEALSDGADDVAFAIRALKGKA